MPTPLPLNETADMIARILLAAVLGALIGFERDKHGRAAGLRTHLLVSMGAAAFMVMSARVAASAQGSTSFIADPGRIAAQIVTGIGFLGAGAIVKSRNNVRGLTTAACLWAAAGIGMAAGGGYWLLALVTTGVALLALVGLKGLERLYAKDSYRTLTVVTGLDVTPSDVIDLVKRPSLTILNVDIARDYARGAAEVRLSIRLYHKGVTDKLAHGIISSLEMGHLHVQEIKWSQV